MAEVENSDDADLRVLIRDPRYRAAGRDGDAFRAEVTRRFAERYAGPFERNLSGRMVQVRAYDRRGDRGGVEHVSAHQRGARPQAAAPANRGNRGPAPQPRGPAPPAARQAPFRAPDLVPPPAKEWERQDNPAFRDAIARSERSAHRADHGYGDRREDWGAVGRYQMRAPALREIKWLEGTGPLRQDTTAWRDAAHDAGVRSTEDFLRNAAAQEVAFDVYLREIERELIKKELWPRIGQTVRIGTATVELTAPGLVAAAHRVGAAGLRDVLAGRRPDLAGPVLTRLRDFGARDAQGSLRTPYLPLNNSTPRPSATPRRGAAQ